MRTLGPSSAALAQSSWSLLLMVLGGLHQFRGLFLRNDCLPIVIVTNRDLTLMNAVKIVFPECTNLLCRFHIDKNVKAKCKSLIGQKNVWDYVMDNWGTLVDCPSEQQFAESLQKFQIAFSSWPMFVDYDTWIIPHKEKFITAWTNKVMHLGNTTTNRVESAHWALKRVLQNSLGDLCSVWDAMNNMITLQHVEIKVSFETSTHVVEHRLVGMVSRNALNEIVGEVERLRYLGNDPSSYGYVMRSTLGLPCACELSRYTTGSIPVDSDHMFWRRLCFSDQGLCEAEVSIKEEIETISKIFEELDVCGKLTLKNIAYPDHNSMCPPPSKVNTKGAPKKPMKRSQRSTKRDPSYWEYVDAFHSLQSKNSSVKRSASSSKPSKPTRIIPMLDQFTPFIQDFIHNVVDVKVDGNCGYRSIASLLGMGEDSWPLVRNKLIKELGRWSHDYTNLFGGTKKFEQLRLSLLVDGFSKEMGYVIVSRYNIILVPLSRKQSMTFFPLRNQPPPDSSVHCMICVSHVFGNHFVQVYLKDPCPLPPLALLWSINCYSQAKQWTTPYISRMQQYTSLMSFKRDYLIDKQFLDEIHYRQPFTHTGNQICFQCMQLINDDDFNIIIPNEVINLLERTTTPTHDALLYYNGRWNMPPQNKFVGYTFTGKNPKKFEIPSGCTLDELKDLIKQVAPKGIPPHGIHESQAYSDKIIKYEINELKTDDEVLKVLVQSNYWKKYGPIEILAVFTKHGMEFEDDVDATSLND
ncbi:hypothetical protein HKD37_13G036485 [Glycine soja]